MGDVLARLTPAHRAVLVLRDLESVDERVAAVAMLEVSTGTVKSRFAPGTAKLPRGVGRMSDSWPVVDLDPVRRLRVLAASVPGTAFAEGAIAVPFDQVWSVASDLADTLPAVLTDVRWARITWARDVRQCVGSGNLDLLVSDRGQGTRRDEVARCVADRGGRGGVGLRCHVTSMSERGDRVSSLLFFIQHGKRII